ncbi:unnamed protein product, partial [Symbiodinium pilosum]
EQALHNEEIEEEPQPPPEAENAEQQQRRRDIQRKVMHLHRVTGHGSVASLVHALKARGAAEDVIQAARDLQCPTCQEHRRPAPRRHATLETLPRKWERIQIDRGDWTHPVHRHKLRFVMIIDEGSRFRAGRVLSGPARRAGTWEDIQKVYEQIWLPTHGAPAAVRVDPAGPWMSHKADDYFAERGIQLDPIPAEAHWQIGAVERAVRNLKSVLEALAPEFPDMRMFETTDEKPLNNDVFEDGGFGQNIRAMCLAEKAFIDEQARQR